MLLFRRLRKDKEEAQVEGGKPAEKAPPSPAASPPKPEGSATSASKMSSRPIPAPVPSPVVPPPASTPPPRLPEKPPAETVRPRVERGPFGVCFVCGSVLDGRTCPTCRIAWVE